MLLFILCCFCARIFVHCISKHLMLLFIILDSWARSFRFSISKHLMLLFIRSHLHHLPVCLNYFKTSYVIVYHVNQLIKQMNKEFQNILCYCLSQNVYERRWYGAISKHLMLLFIADGYFETLEIGWNFKTSYVIVYPSHFRVF